MDDKNEDFLDLVNFEQETKHLMDQYGLDSDTAQRAKEIMDTSDVTEEEAIEMAEEN